MFPARDDVAVGCKLKLNPAAVAVEVTLASTEGEVEVEPEGITEATGRTVDTAGDVRAWVSVADSETTAGAETETEATETVCDARTGVTEMESEGRKEVTEMGSEVTDGVETGTEITETACDVRTEAAERELEGRAEAEMDSDVDALGKTPGKAELKMVAAGTATVTVDTTVTVTVEGRIPTELGDSEEMPAGELTTAAGEEPNGDADTDGMAEGTGPDETALATDPTRDTVVNETLPIPGGRMEEEEAADSDAGVGAVAAEEMNDN